MNSIEGIQDTLEDTEAGSVLPALALRSRGGRLASRPLGHPGLVRGVGLLWNRQAHRCAAARALAATFKDVVGEMPFPEASS